jgi:hypothetical protein
MFWHDEGRLRFVQELGPLVERFREIEIVLEQPSGLAPDLPASWLSPEQSSVMVRFIHSGPKRFLYWHSYTRPILAARGFRPSAYLPALFWKQFLLIVALTLPAVALAALVRNVAQFMLAAIAAGAVAVFVSGGLTFGPPFPASPDKGRLGLPWRRWRWHRSRSSRSNLYAAGRGSPERLPLPPR